MACTNIARVNKSVWQWKNVKIIYLHVVRAIEKGRISMLLKGRPSVPCRQMDKTVQNTSATFVANDDSCTLEEIVQVAKILKPNAAWITACISKKKLEIAFRQLPCAYGWVTQFLIRRGIEIVPHPAYTPDLTPNDFFLYPSPKRMLKGHHFPNLWAIHMELHTQLQCLSKDRFATLIIWVNISIAHIEGFFFCHFENILFQYFFLNMQWMSS